MALTLLAVCSLVLALIPAILFCLNLRAYLAPPAASTSALDSTPAISILIPARNEELSIEAAVASALASRGIDLEVLVLDDHSTDATAARVSAIAARDSRVRLLPSPPLPPGWCGKQHACAALARSATRPLLLFIDADVRLRLDGAARLAGFLEKSGADLVSGIPRQETGTLLEKLVIPLIHFVLLGFLPIGRMRRSRHPSYGAGCGQLFLARRSAYQLAGGHAVIRESLHDGVKLPRAFRSAGLRTDLCDATDIADCRMYRGAAALWHGLAKNATEGLAAPATILPATLLLLLGQVVPFALLASAPLLSPLAIALAVSAAVAALLPRLMGVFRFRQSLFGALLHPLGILVLLAIQWYAFAVKVIGRPANWKGRDYGSGEFNSNVASPTSPARQELA